MCHYPQVRQQEQEEQEEADALAKESVDYHRLEGATGGASTKGLSSGYGVDDGLGAISTGNTRYGIVVVSVASLEMARRLHF